MVNIQTRRAGIICLAAVVHDDLRVSTTWGLTQEGARRRWLRRESRR